jgi:hypothetical protein
MSADGREEIPARYSTSALTYKSRWHRMLCDIA